MTFIQRIRSHFNTASRGSTREQALDISLGRLLLLTLVLSFISLASIEFTRNANSIAILWPSNAILLAVLLRSTRHWTNFALILLGGGSAIAFANLVSGNSPALSVGLTIGNIVEVAAAWVLVVIYQGNDSNLTCIRNLIIFIVLAGGIAPLASASIGAAAMASLHAIPWVPIWLNWYASDALGMIIVAPFLLSLRT
jgi:integral membrane sensor domain MASE1